MTSGEADCVEPYRVVIVGGGTAGWITAAVLQRTFASDRPVRITLVESPEVRRIGVGEATIPTLRRTLAYLGIGEREFLKETEATFKHAVRFVDWAEKGHSYYHTFEAFFAEELPAGVDQWVARRARGEARPFAYEFGIQATAADARKAPKTLADPDGGGLLTYAYHVDADLFADLLAKRASSAGVTHLRDKVVETRLHPESGDIEALILQNGDALKGDFFVDCTGFLALLIGKALGVPFIDYSRYLLCDRAVTIRVPASSPERDLRPFTTAQAASAGWAWHIDLQSRSGHGYVYGSPFLSEEEAEAELRAMLPSTDGLEAKHLRLRVGRMASSWQRNCVAIGLAGGFIEPLESTGIALIEISARLLARYLPFRGPDPMAAALFNRKLSEMYEEIRDFIVAHYCVSRRRDTPFWREVVKKEHIPERLQEHLALWSRYPPSQEELASPYIFRAYNYQQVLYGMDWLPEETVRRAGRYALDLPPADLEPRRAAALRALPDHRAYLAARLAQAEV